MKGEGAELRIRAPGQHAITIAARNGILRGAMHPMEEDLKKRDIPINCKRLFAEALFACNACAFYNCVPPYNALLGRRPARLPDLDVPDRESLTGS